MIRRSTLVFLTCLAALGVPAMRTQSAASAAVRSQALSSQLLLAQASSGESSSGTLSSTPLGIGSTGEAVSALQRRLRQSNYYSGSVDGLYGLGTQKAVIAFQADQGLSQTGSMTDETWERLQSFVPSEGSPATASDVTTADTSVAGNSADAGDGDSASQPVTAPTDSELPPVGGERAATAAADESQGDSGGLGKIFGLSLGLVALLSSFGVGFYFANRSKSEPEEPEGNDWSSGGAVGSDLSPSIPAPSSPNAGVPSIVDTGIGNGGAFSSNGASANGNGASRGGSSLATAAASSTSLRTGQIGGTAPLAQVDIIEGLIGDLRNPDPTRRRKAIWELGQRGNSLAMQPLVDSMVNADSKEKSLVLAALSEIGIRSLKPMSRALAIALQDDNPDVRKNGIRDLTRVYELVVQISQMLGHATEDEDPEVRQTATWALDQLNRIRRSQDLDSTVRTFTGTTASPPIDLLSSEASMRRNSQ